MGIGQIPDLRCIILYTHLFPVDDGLSGGCCVLHFVGAAARDAGRMNECEASERALSNVSALLRKA